MYVQSFDTIEAKLGRVPNTKITSILYTDRQTNTRTVIQTGLFQYTPENSHLEGV